MFCSMTNALTNFIFFFCCSGRLEAKLCIGMVLFELHGGMIGEQRKEVYTVMHGIRHIQRLEQAGFHHYKTEQVWVGGHAQAEMAFVNISWLALNPGLPIVPLPKHSMP